MAHSVASVEFSARSYRTALTTRSLTLQSRAICNLAYAAYETWHQNCTTALNRECLLDGEQLARHHSTIRFGSASHRSIGLRFSYPMPSPHEGQCSPWD